jgi:hypothetical protein
MKTKVNIKYVEVQIFERDCEIELTGKQLKEFNKSGKLPFEIENQLCSETDLKNHVITVPTYSQK